MSDTSSGNLSTDSPITNLTADCLGYRHLTSLRQFWHCISYRKYLVINLVSIQLIRL